MTKRRPTPNKTPNDIDDLLGDGFTRRPARSHRDPEPTRIVAEEVPAPAPARSVYQTPPSQPAAPEKKKVMVYIPHDVLTELDIMAIGIKQLVPPDMSAHDTSRSALITAAIELMLSDYAARAEDSAIVTKLRQ